MARTAPAGPGVHDRRVTSRIESVSDVGWLALARGLLSSMAMRLKPVVVGAVATLFTWAAMPVGVVRADCVDPLQCICPWNQEVAAVGVIEDIRTEMSDNGFEARIGTLRIESLSFAADANEGRFVAGETVDLTLLSETSAVGARVLATASPESIGMSELQTITGGTVSCASGTFAEAEARDLIVASDCREQVKDRVDIPECNDTVSPFNCSTVAGEERRAADATWWLVAVAVAVAWRRRRVGAGR